MAKHTPGPWTTDGICYGGQQQVTQAGTGGSAPKSLMIVAEVNGKEGEQEANARLIAAAPEMFGLLQMLDRAWASHPAVLHEKMTAVIQPARALLARIGKE